MATRSAGRIVHLSTSQSMDQLGQMAQKRVKTPVSMKTAGWNGGIDHARSWFGMPTIYGKHGISHVPTFDRFDYVVPIVAPEALAMSNSFCASA